MRFYKTSSRTYVPKLLIIICGLLWLVGFTHGSGFGEAYNILNTTKSLVTIILLGLLLVRSSAFRVNIGGVLAVLAILYIAFYNELKNDKAVIDYLWVWFIIPIVSLFPLQKVQMKWIGIVFGAVSTLVLLIGNVTNVFDGWDGNSVSLMQFFSYTVFMSVYIDVKDKKTIRNIVLFSIVYLFLLSAFDSRGAMLFSIAMLLCTISVIPVEKFLKKRTIIIILLIPLIIAVLITTINDFAFVEKLNDWSLKTFQKPIFNGRDTIWESGFETWWESPFVGNGSFALADYYHNNAVAILVASGAIGYFLLISTIYKFLNRGLVWLEDSVVRGLITAFLIIWLQQAVEKGLISSQPNVIPYLLLGLLCARINTLEGKNGKRINNSSGLQYRKLSS